MFTEIFQNRIGKVLTSGFFLLETYSYLKLSLDNSDNYNDNCSEPDSDNGEYDSCDHSFVKQVRGRLPR